MSNPIAILDAARAQTLTDPVSIGWHILISAARYLAVGEALFRASREAGHWPSVAAMWWPDR